MGFFFFLFRGNFEKEVTHTSVSYFPNYHEKKKKRKKRDKLYIQQSPWPQAFPKSGLYKAESPYSEIALNPKP
jgi:hypothetical protein